MITGQDLDRQQKCRPRSGRRQQSCCRLLVVVGAAQIVSAVGADQFAAVAGELMAAGGADAAVVVDTGGFEAGIGKSIGEVGTFARA